jgi:lipoate-protein ligase A
MTLHVLPTRSAGAAENMAVDFLLLQRYPEPAAARFRHYGWHRPAFTFGYSQKIAFVRAQLPAVAPCDLCRRVTGGGIVDHRDDWPYTLVIPRGHPLEEQRAAESYRAVHAALAAALQGQRVPAEIKLACEPAAASQTCGAGGVCFQRAELYDVVHARSGEKIAGAAQKRNKHGLLLQGSLWRPAAGADLDWDRFHEDFAGGLAKMLGGAAAAAPWPELAEDEIMGLMERYAAPEWTDYR